MITLVLTGDVMLGRGVAEAIDRRLLRPEEPWGDVMPLLDAADLRIINLECPLTELRAAVDPHAQASSFQGPTLGHRDPAGCQDRRLFAGQQPHRGFRGTGLARYPRTPGRRRHSPRRGRP